MDLDKKYFTAQGDPCNILQLVKMSPEWAANRIQVGEKAIEILRKIKDWVDAYPLKVFPEPDFKKVEKVLKENGMSLGCVSASNMCHVLNGIKDIIDRE